MSHSSHAYAPKFSVDCSMNYLYMLPIYPVKSFPEPFPKGFGFVHFPGACESESEVAQSCRLFVTPWTVAHQAPPSMGFSRQEYWSGLPFPSSGDLPDPGI